MSEINDKITEYYTDKITHFGATAKGVDWNSEESQYLRFKQLTKVLSGDKNGSFTLLDFGCGYGELIHFLKDYYSNIYYTGFDLSSEMIKNAKERSQNYVATWTTNEAALVPVDYAVASGIFNVKLKFSDSDWLEHIFNTLKRIDRLSLKGFSFNLLTHYSDIEFMKDYLYYADPCKIFDFCKRNFSNHVALLHDYPLYEFSIIVRKK